MKVYVITQCRYYAGCTDDFANVYEEVTIGVSDSKEKAFEMIKTFVTECDHEKFDEFLMTEDGYSGGYDNECGFEVSYDISEYEVNTLVRF